MDRAGVDIDIISFCYSTALWRNMSIEDAATSLQKILEDIHATLGRTVPHQHIFFITHSTGGLVVKQFLVNVAEEELERAFSTEIAPKRESVIDRIRAIDHLAVPHRGASPLVTWPLALGTVAWYGLFGWWMSPLMNASGRTWGLNRLNLQLRWNNRWVKELDDSFRKVTNSLELLAFPHPVSRDILAEQDIVVLQLKEKAGEAGSRHDRSSRERKESPQDDAKFKRYDTESVTEQLRAKPLTVGLRGIAV